MLSIFPGDGALALVWLIAFYAVVFGIVPGPLLASDCGA